MNLIANNLTYKPSEEYHLNEVSFNFKEGIYTQFLEELYQVKQLY